MKEKIKDLAGNVKEYLVPGLITLAGVVFILIFRGIWPFGSNRIDYFDNMQQVAPLYAHLWDWLHGDASIWFDWYTGLGTNMSMSMSAFSMLSPFNLILYLVPRNLILESISIMTIVKMVFMAVAMYALLDMLNKKLIYPLKVTFSVMYAFCGYVILYGSCFTPWMDIVALFPVLMLALYRMINTGKKLFYILMVGLIFIINYYVSAMILVYIFFVVGIYMLLKAERGTLKEHSWNVGIGTISGLGLSAVCLLPTMLQLSSSQRAASGSGIIKQYMGWLTSSVVSDGPMAALQRWMMLYGLAFVLAVIVIGMKKVWPDKKERNYIGAMLLLVLLPMVVQGTNLMWHFGSYNGYTLRNGFLIAFTLICIAARFAEKMFKDIPIERKYVIRQSIIAGAICVAFAIAYNIMPKSNNIAAIIFFMAVLITMLIVYIRKLTEKKDEFNCKSVIALIAVEVFFGAYALIGPPKFYAYEDYQVGDYVQLANTAYEDLNIEESPVERIVNPDISLNANYPLILRRGALSSFTAALQSDTQKYAKKWGYSRYFLWTLDSGGTVFTNALLHVTEAVNQNVLDPSMYTLKKEEGDYKLYSANYQLPFVMLMDDSAATSKILTEGNWISLHNYFYSAMTSDKSSLVSGIPYSVKTREGISTYNMDINPNSAVYLSIADTKNREADANVSKLISSIHIYVNDEPVVIPTLGDVKNTAYFTDYNNNLVYLGTFDDENITVRIEYDNPQYLSIAEVMFGQLDMTKMANLCSLYSEQKSEVAYTDNSITMTFNADAEKNYAVVPLIYSKNWQVTLNGEKVKAKEIAGLFTGVKVHAGENTITMTFVPRGRREGAFISLAALLVLLVCLIINHFKKISVWNGFKYCAVFIYLQLFNLAVLGMFLIPVIMVVPAFFYQLFIKIKQFF
ncbi:MAG: YfhO family protein [Eubacteriales bacterium]|nr:YfhO family protein [Eubacteriales bacterium]